MMVSISQGFLESFQAPASCVTHKAAIAKAEQSDSRQERTFRSGSEGCCVQLIVQKEF